MFGVNIDFGLMDRFNRIMIMYCNGTRVKNTKSNLKTLSIKNSTGLGTLTDSVLHN